MRNLPELKTFVSFISPQCLSQTHFTRSDNVLSSHITSRPSESLARYSPSHWCCVHLLPKSPGVVQLLSAGLLSFSTSATEASLPSVAAVAGSSGPHGGTVLDYPLSKGSTKLPSPAAWMKTQHQLGSVRPVSTGKPRIMASSATLQCCPTIPQL